MLLLLDENNPCKLKVAACYGYETNGIGAEVNMGEGIIGVVAKRKKLMRMGNIGSQRAYINTVKNQMAAAGQKTQNNIVLPGLSNVESQVAIPLLLEGNLVGVLAVESEKANVFDSRDELIITILANQAASAIEKARAHQKLKQINENLEHLVSERTKEVVEQKELIEEKNREVMSSITYAKRIQSALLPSKKYLDEHNGDDYFVLFRPKDIVSGDFYWVNKKEDKLFLAAIDCTGHGVPGALMSIVAHSNLQRAIHVFHLHDCAGILDMINETLVAGFKESEEGIRDGMDITLYAINKEKMQLEFAGANNSLYIINPGRKTWPEQSYPIGESIAGVEICGDKQPIGYFEASKKFTGHLIDLQKGDTLYTFSDGYADQFGGPRGKKFMTKRLKELLVSIYHHPMHKQKEIIEQAHLQWRGNLEQVDDILVMGMRV